MKITFTDTDDDVIEFRNATARSAFSIEYLKEIFKIAKDDYDTVKLEIGNDLPIHLDFSLEDGMVRVEYYLAPRLLEEEEY